MPIVAALGLAQVPGAASAIGVGLYPAVSEPRGSATRVLTAGRTLSRWFEEGAIDRLWPRLSPALQTTLGGKSGLAEFRRNVQQVAGREAGLVQERTIPWLRSFIYNRAVRRSNASGVWWTQWTVSGEHATAFLVQPAPTAAPSARLDYRTKTPLRLPFRGPWFVFWGGRTTLENYHAASASQRFAYDFVVARGGRTSRDAKPSANGDYLCFGRPIVAPAAGVVTTAVGHIPDNAPGRMNEHQPLGNHIVLDHDGREVSFLAHLRQGSLTVREGQRVRSGDPLGQCGNSGRSSEPHLHYHLQSTADAAGLGLPAQFTTYWADGGSVDRGEPRRGQFVAPGTASAFETMLGGSVPTPSASVVPWVAECAVVTATRRRSSALN